MRRALTLRAVHVTTAVVTACVVLTTLAGPQAFALLLVAGPTATPANATSGVATTYTFGTFTTEGGENVSQIIVTFPEGTTFSNPTSPTHAGTVAVSGRTVTLTLANRIPAQTEFSFSFAGIVNPPAGDDRTCAILFTVTNPAGNNPRPVPQPPAPPFRTSEFVIEPPPHISMSLSTTEVSFELYPDVPAEPQQVVVTVDSSHDFRIDRAVSGEGDAFGLSVDGQAEGPKSGGVAAFTDTFTAQAPWTTEGDRTYTATVTYTVVQ